MGLIKLVLTVCCVMAASVLCNESSAKNNSSSCTQEQVVEAKEILRDFENKGLFKRDDEMLPTVRYDWKKPWGLLPAGQQYETALTLHGVDVCLWGKGVITRISYGGKDVVRVKGGSVEFLR